MIAIRLNPFTPDFTDRALEEIEKHPGCCDEVWLAMYSYEPVEKHREKSRLMGDYIRRLRAKGFRPFIEYGTNLGHGNPVGFDVPEEFENMRDKNGSVASDCFCPAGENFLNYQCEVISLYAAQQPDGIYLDDDLRIESHQCARLGCFCENCIREFNETNHTCYSLEEISVLIDTDPDFREKYTDMNRRHLYEYGRRMSEAAMSVCPDIQMGWEYVFISSATGSDFEPVFRGMRDATKKSVLSRPGALVYNDNNPRMLLDKVLNTSYQNSLAPDYVTGRRPEIENTSHTYMGKTARGTCIEGTLNLAYGCSGLSFSMCQSNSEPMHFYGKIWQAFSDHRAYWQGLISDLENTGVSGVRLVYPDDAYKAPIPGELRWMNPPKETGRKLIEAGIPISYEDDYCNVYLLFADIVPWLSDAAIRDLLTKNVIADGLVPHLLAERGFHLPVRTQRITDHSFDVLTRGEDCYFSETYTDHPFNGEWKNHTGHLDVFCGGHSCQSLITDDSCGILAFGENGRVSQALAHLPEGGTWAFVGSSLRTHITGSAKRNQLLVLIDSLSGGLPAYLKTAAQAAFIPRATKEGQFRSATILNISIDDTDPLELIIRRPVSERFILSSPDHEEIPLNFTVKNGAYHIVLPSLPPYKNATVRAK